MLLPVTKFTAICYSSPTLGANPGLFPVKAVEFTEQGQWSRGDEAGDLGSKMGRGDEGRAEGGHLGSGKGRQSILLGRRLQVGLRRGGPSSSATRSWSLPLADCAMPLPHPPSQPPPPPIKGTQPFGSDKSSLPGQRWVLRPNGEQKGRTIGH